jgi:hypothetical protein
MNHPPFVEGAETPGHLHSSFRDQADIGGAFQAPAYLPWAQAEPAVHDCHLQDSGLSEQAGT